MDLQFRCTYWNKASELLTGVAASDALGKHLYDVFLRGEPVPRAETVFRRALETGQPQFLEETYHLGEEERILEIAAYPSENGLSVFARDITEPKRADQIKDEFCGMVSHELKTPLTVIIGALDVAAAEGVSREQVLDLMRDAMASAEGLAAIVDNLLELSRHQADRLVLQPRPTDIQSIAQGVVERLQLMSDNHRLTVDMPQGLTEVNVDTLRMERVLHNLVENAIKYSPGGGEVRVFSYRRNGQLVIGVSDQGVGIQPKDQRKLFQSFERLGTSGRNGIPGMGLGLRVSRILVEAHGGRMWVESEPGKGSTFFLTLPVAKKDGE